MHIFPVQISSLISHVAAATLLLLEKIYPRKSDANLKQVILFILLLLNIFTCPVVRTIIHNRMVALAFAGTIMRKSNQMP